MQGQKKLSFSALALSVWTAALAESLEPGVSLRGMLLYGGLGALLLTGISAVLYVCWQQTAVRQVWLFAAVLGLLAEVFRTAMQAQSVCRQEFHSMALIGLLPLLLWAGCRIPLSGAGGGALSGRHCRPDGVVPSAGTGCGAAGPAAACTAVRGVSALAPSDGRTCAAPRSFSAVADLFGTGVFGGTDYPEQELLRAWSVGIFSRMDALLLLIWLTCAVFRIGFLCAAVGELWKKAANRRKGAAG